MIGAGLIPDTMILLTKPFTICKFLVMFGLKTTAIVVETLVELLKTSIMLHLNLFGKSIIWLLALLSLPSRVLSALQRERMLEENLHELRIELATLLWEKEELADKFQASIKECRTLEMMLAEVEDENDRAIAEIEMLESQLQVMQFENLQLKEIQEKGYWDSKKHDGKGNGQSIGGTDNYGLSNRIQTRNSKGRGILGQDPTMCKDEQEERKNNPKARNCLNAMSTPGGSLHQFLSGNSSMNININARDEKRDLALLQSLFSAILSLLVGMIIWQAKDPCMPLVVALFTVVAMSLKSVVQFFSTIENKPASDAFALLSLNWFILGTLAYPTLPRVARVVAVIY